MLSPGTVLSCETEALYAGRCRAVAMLGKSSSVRSDVNCVTSASWALNGLIAQERVRNADARQLLPLVGRPLWVIAVFLRHHGQWT